LVVVGEENCVPEDLGLIRVLACVGLLAACFQSESRSSARLQPRPKLQSRMIQNLNATGREENSENAAPSSLKKKRRRTSRSDKT
jgi:hypothetical protein